MKAWTLLFSMIFPLYLCAQILPADRSADWTQAGLKSNFTPCYILQLNDYGGDSTGANSSNAALIDALADLNDKPGIILFSDGNYFFDQTIVLPSNCVLRGNGADATTLRFDLGGSGDGILIRGDYGGDPDTLSQSVEKGAKYLLTSDAINYMADDYVTLYMDDAHLRNDIWAANQIAHFLQIKNISDDTIFIDQKIRLNYDQQYFPRVRKIFPKENVGIENLKIVRKDATGSQSKNIFMRRAVNCWVRGVELDSCNFGHVVIQQSAYCAVSGCHMQNAFDYGTGGKAYGVVIEGGANLNRVENNVFNHLRHSILLQSGANANVIAFNYSTDPFWSGFPNNSGGDIVLHGNYPFLNLFESNVVANMRIDASHGGNGPFNTLFRNRGELYGLIMSNSPPSDSQNIIGNEITGTGIFQGNYTTAGVGHFEYGNNVKGNTIPTGTSDLSDMTDITYAYNYFPDFLPCPPDWPYIGYPNTLDDKSIPAQDRFLSGVPPYTDNIILYDILQNANRWTGCTTNSQWHDPQNWSWQQLPDLETNVQIGSPVFDNGFLPILSQQSVIIKSLEIISPATMTVVAPAFLTVK